MEKLNQPMEVIHKPMKIIPGDHTYVLPSNSTAICLQYKSNLGKALALKIYELNLKTNSCNIAK